MIGWIREFSKGDNLSLFWRLFRLRGRMKQPLLRQGLTFLLNRMAHRRGGYVGNGAVVGTDVPDNCTVVAQPHRVIFRRESL